MAILLMVGLWMAISLLMALASLYRSAFSGSSLEFYDEQVLMLLRVPR